MIYQHSYLKKLLKKVTRVLKRSNTTVVGSTEYATRTRKASFLPPSPRDDGYLKSSKVSTIGRRLMRVRRPCLAFSL